MILTITHKCFIVTGVITAVLHSKARPLTEGPKGLGGWILLLFISQCFSLYSNFSSIYHYVETINFTWIFSNVFSIALNCFLLWAMIKRKVYFPWSKIWLLGINVIYSVHFLLTIDARYKFVICAKVLSIFISAIWAFYLYHSKRVKNTFVNY
ncbi:MAG: DUF2569 family protein [Candidatus Paracaedibacteraceae bacterium]|nr:DUF2569 family protein [Candidatus Paracaedibacteraceae bacterium]